MHYYQFNIADYSKDTGHLSHLENGIYLRLLNKYYLDETPIALKNISRKMAIRTEEDGNALQNVLDDFFCLSACGEFYTHKRVDAEIAKYQAKSDQARVNGKKGGRPQKPTETQGVSDGLAEITQGVNSGLADGTQTKANSVTKELNNSGTQELRNLGTQELIKTTTQSSKHLSSKKLDVMPEIIEYLNNATGKNFKPVESHAKHIRSRLAEGHTVDDIKAVIDRKTAQWKNTENAEYLRPATLFNAEKFNQYIGEVGQPPPTGFGKQVETKQQSVDRINAQAKRVAENIRRNANG